MTEEQEIKQGYYRRFMKCTHVMLHGFFEHFLPSVFVMLLGAFLGYGIAIALLHGNVHLIVIIAIISVFQVFLVYLLGKWRTLAAHMRDHVIRLNEHMMSAPMLMMMHQHQAKSNPGNMEVSRPTLDILIEMLEDKATAVTDSEIADDLNRLATSIRFAIIAHDAEDDKE